jgi:hypothetical protein
MRLVYRCRFCYAEVMFFGLKPESNVVRVGTSANYVYEHIGHASTLRGT